MKVKIEEIKVNPGRRAVSQDGIEELAFSIEQIGLLNPITLTEDRTLVAGLHRLEAVKSLGWTEIECTISDLDGLTAQLAELDENFARTNLSPLEIGDFLKRRKEIYEELYPETKAGVAQAIGRNKAKGKSTDCNLQSKKPFIEDTADLTGQHPSTISRHIKVASELTPEAKEILKDAAKPVPHSTLSKISKLKPEQQKEASSLLVSGEIKSVDEYLASKIEPKPTKDWREDNDLSPETPGDITALIMGMAYFTDGINSDVKAFLEREDTFRKLSRGNVWYLVKMLDTVNRSVKALGELVTDCLLESK